MSNIIVFYHNVSKNTPCPDGIFSAAVAHKYFGNQISTEVKYIGCCYVPKGEIPPEYDIPQSGDTVYILDFSFEHWVLQDWLDRDITFKLIDHHEKKMQELLGMRSLEDMIVFNNYKCGAILTWEYFFPNKPIPAILAYIDDRDRWQHRLPYTHEIHAAAGALGRSFELFSMLEPLSSDQLVAVLGKLGAREVAAKKKKIEELASAYEWRNIQGHEVPVVKLAPNEEWARSEVSHYLYEKFPEAPFAACYYISEEDGTSQIWGAYNNPDSDFDIQPIAKSLGGDGHASACGWIVRRG